MVAVQYDTVTSTTRDGTWITVTHNTAVQPGMIGVLGVSAAAGAGAIVSVLWDGSAMTQLSYAAATGDTHTWLYYIWNPTSGAKAVTFTCTNSVDLLCGARTYYNVGIIQDATVGGGAAGVPSITVPSSTGAMVIDVVTSVVIRNVGAGQTQRVALLNASREYQSDEGGASPSVVMNWIDNNGAWTQIGTSLQGLPGNQFWIIGFQMWDDLLRDLKRGLLPPNLLQKRYRQALGTLGG